MLRVSVCVCVRVHICIVKSTPKPKLETVLNSILSVQMSAMASSQPLELEISTPGTHHCLQDADVSLVWFPARGYIRQELWEQGQLVLRRSRVTVLLQGPPLSWWPLLASCLSSGGWSCWASWRKAQCKRHYPVCTICSLSKCLPRSSAGWRLSSPAASHA